MIPTVYSLEEAMAWFLEHSSGYVMCVRHDGHEKECNSFPEARAFYEPAGKEA